MIDELAARTAIFGFSLVLAGMAGWIMSLIFPFVYSAIAFGVVGLLISTRANYRLDKELDNESLDD